jgi:hypothetical protein
MKTLKETILSHVCGMVLYYGLEIMKVATSLKCKRRPFE